MPEMPKPLEIGPNLKNTIETIALALAPVLIFYFMRDKKDA